ncbi:lipid droplet-associated protein [Mycobacterium sp. MYCO198283]|uniref:lipid droplet-associated protein n=1 Tax=Mycobacterium sp. MYCO198283 TaxID=2883505 RepID=UPI001E553A7F|nr:lipid droplet-associated protein [Mycobacterium sp. MYCO198283]MCG5430850.1 lipid droplet-associated protein [Mycobacterium sp. MYCO198283]
MSPAPYGVRLAVGAAVTVVEETRKLPQTILMYPMTLVSQAAHMVMRFQQNVAELVIKGDATLESIFPPKDEQPEWATFDEDLGEDDDPPSLSSESDRERLTEGRFALYSQAPDTGGDAPADESPGAELPSVAAELDYDSLTLAQLRARLQSLSVADLQALLAYEEATRARAPFQTLLANRITRASAPK